MPNSPVAVAAIPDLGFLSVQGDDSESFLQAQLSQDMRAVTPEACALAAWHDAKGRVRGLFRVLRQRERFILVTSARAAPDIVVALKRFVLRARVQIEPIADWRGLALIGAAEDWLSQHAARAAHADGSVTPVGGALGVRLGPRLWHLYGPAEAIAALGAAPDAAPEEAVAAEIRLGLPSVTPEIAGAYVPHMLNLDSLGALAFKKGCYPGQEVIARTEHLGTVKRRARVFRSKRRFMPPTGAAIVDAAGATIGHVIRSVAIGDVLELLAVVALDRLGEPLFLEAVDSPPTALELVPFEAAPDRSATLA